MDGALPILDSDVPGVHLPHSAAAHMLLNQGRNIRRTDTRGVITIPLALAIGGLRGRGADGIVSQLDRIHKARLARQAQTSIQIGPGRLHASSDLGVTRLTDAGPDRVQDGTDDPVLARLLALYGVTHLARTEGGLDARWRMHGRSAHPYVNYAGLPDDLPPFILRPHSIARASLVEVEFGQGVIYSNLGAFRMIQVEHPIPATIAIGLEGKRVTDVIAHPALTDLVFGAPDDHGGPCVHVVNVMMNQS